MDNAAGSFVIVIAVERQVAVRSLPRDEICMYDTTHSMIHKNASNREVSSTGTTPVC